MRHEGEEEMIQLNCNWTVSNSASCSVKKRKRCIYTNNFLLCH